MTGSAQEPLEVDAVTGFAETLDVRLHPGAIDPPLMIGNFLETGDFQALAVLDDGHELRGFEEGVVGAGIEPRSAAAEELDEKLAPFEVEAVEVGDLEFAAGGGLEALGERDDFAIVKIQARHGVVGLGLLRFLLKR